MNWGALLAMLFLVQPAGANAPCDAGPMVERARLAKRDADLDAWLEAAAKFRKSCDARAWDTLIRNPFMESFMKMITMRQRGRPARVGPRPTGTTRSPGSRLLRPTSTYESFLLELRLEVAQARCPGLRRCAVASAEPLRRDALKALRSHLEWAVRSPDDDRIIHLAEQLRKMGGLDGMSIDAIKTAARVAPLLEGVDNLQIDQDTLARLGPELKDILETPDRGTRNARLVAYIGGQEASGSASYATVLQSVIEQGRALQDLRGRIGAGQLGSLLIDTQPLEAGTAACNLSRRVRDAATLELSRSASSGETGVKTDPRDCHGGCSILFQFRPAICQSGTQDEPGCVEMRLRLANGAEWTKPMLVASKAQLCEDAPRARVPVETALRAAIVDVNRIVALSATMTGPPTFVSGQMVTPTITEETSFDASIWNAGLRIDPRSTGAPIGFEQQLLGLLERFRRSGFGPVVDASSTTVTAARLAWERTPEGALAVRLTTAEDGRLPLLEMHFTDKDVKESTAPTLALSTTLTLVEYYATGNPRPSLSLTDVSPATRSRAARATHLLIAGFPGLSDRDTRNDRTSRVLAAVDASLMASAAGLATGAMVERTRYHRNRTDSLSLSRGLFVGAQVALVGAVVTKIVGLVVNP